MPTLLCHIEINPGMAEAFEEVMKEMYRCTHAQEPNCVRYEYYRGAQPDNYYCLLSFTNQLAFWEHQASDYHEGFDFASIIKSLDMEWVDPVTGASPLLPTESGEVPDGASEAVAAAAGIYPVNVQSWWQQHRK